MGLSTIARQYSIRKLSVLFRLGGAGYKVLANLHHRRSRRWERLWVVLQRPDGDSPLAFEWWLGSSRPLDPYLNGRLREKVLKEVRPRELRLPGGSYLEDGLITDAELEILERTVMFRWMLQWQQWLRWYVTIALNPYTPLRTLFDYPVVETSWKRRNVDHDLVRFGLLWKCYDWAVKMRNFRPVH